MKTVLQLFYQLGFSFFGNVIFDRVQAPGKRGKIGVEQTIFLVTVSFYKPCKLFIFYFVNGLDQKFC